MEVQETWKYLQYRKPGNISSTGNLEISQVQETWKYLKYRKPVITQVHTGNLEYFMYRKPGIFLVHILYFYKIKTMC